jgi:choline-sulfatase
VKRAALLIALIAIAAACGKRENDTFRGAPVILISVDTLRADHLPMYGYRAVETPAFDALRRDGILFSNAYSHVPLTFPSHASLFTGLLPPHNHVRNNIGYTFDPKLATLPKALHGAGYATGAAVSAYVLRGTLGLAPLFDFYEDKIQSDPGKPVGALQRAGSATAAAAKEWIGQHDNAPFFFFLHLYEPHSPYTPPEPFLSRYASSKYDGEIATADAVIGDFLSFLKARGVYDKAIIIFLSDHGEGLLEHGDPEHGIFLYREEIHVPLVVKLPKSARAGDAIADPVGLVDIFPTVTQLTHVATPPKLDGVSLFAQHDSARRIYGETLYPRIHLGWSDLYSLTDRQFEFIKAPRPELYDVQRDPGELTNVLTSQRRAYASMREEIDRLAPPFEAPSNFDPEEAKKLGALGYLGSTAAPSAGPLPDPKDRIGEIGELVQAGTLAHEGRDAEALPLFSKVVKENPRLSDAWNQYGASLEHVGRYEEAIAAYRKTADLSRELAPYLAIGSLYLKLGKFNEAAQHAELGMKTNPGGAHMLLARVAEAKKDFATAEREARVAQNDRYTNLSASVFVAKVLAETGRPAEALQILDAASAQIARDGGAKVEMLDGVRGDALARLQRYPEAVAALQAEIVAFPNDLEAYSHLAVIYALTQSIESARGVMQQMVRVNHNPPARRFAATTLNSLGDREGAAQFR